MVKFDKTGPNWEWPNTWRGRGGCDFKWNNFWRKWRCCNNNLWFNNQFNSIEEKENFLLNELENINKNKK